MKRDSKNLGFNLKDFVIEKFTLFFSIGFLILNLIIFAFVIRESMIFSLVLAGIFLIYIPMGCVDKAEQIWVKCSRVLEVIMALALTLAYIFLFKKFWLLFLPALEIFATLLFYFKVYRGTYGGYNDGRGSSRFLR